MRKAKRIAVDEPARLHPNSWSSIEARLVDFSTAGFRAECEARVRVGFLVTLEIPGIGPADAQVSWSRDGIFGARFLEEIDVAAAEFLPLQEETVLARLLVQRAAAHHANRPEDEVQLRKRILHALPMRKLS